MNKACPIVLRGYEDNLQLLAFSHPYAGNQLVKGTIEVNESLENACIRELYEESGVIAKPSRFLGAWNSGYENQQWGLYLMASESGLPSHWEHYTSDDSGLIFKFFWQPLDVRQLIMQSDNI